MPTEAEKLAELRALYLAGTGIEVAELVKVSWPAPAGDIYYVSTLDTHILRGLFDEIGEVTLDLRLPGREFQDILNDTTISDDTVRLKLWDGDAAVSDLANEHGAGHRVEMFYWFPQVELLLSEWFGHWQEVEENTIDYFQVNIEVGFRSSMLPCPRRGLFNTCSAMFSGWLQTQAEIDEGDCPYNRHLTSAALDAFDPAGGANIDTSSGVIKNAGGNAWNAGVRHSVAVNEGDDAIIKVTRAGPYAAAGFATTASPRNSNTDFLVNLQWNPDGSVTIQSNAVAQRANAAASVSGDDLEIHLRGGRFRFYKAGSELVFSDWTPPAPTYPLYLGIAIQNEGAGVLAVQVKIGASIPAPARGNLDPATSQPYTDCAQTRPHCIARLGDDLSYLGFDTVIQSYVVGQTKGPAITVTTRGNESNLKRPLRVIAGKRHVQDLDLGAYTVEPDTRHPEGGFVSTLFFVSEGPIKSQTNHKVMGQAIAAAHLNTRNGLPRQARTGFSTQVSNYSSTALFFGRAGPGDFTKVSAEDLRGECDVEGSMDVRRYTSETRYVEEYSTDRAWWLLHVMRNKRWGYGHDVARFVIQDFIDLAKWCSEIVSFTDADGTVYTGPRTTFNAELIDRTVQQQVNDICLAGRFSLPFVDHGKLRIKPLAAAPELLLPAQFTEKAFLGSLQRVPTTEERDDWVAALETAIDTSEAALLTEARARVKSLFESGEYAALATTDEQFVTDVYAAYLARVSDPEGRAYYLNLLATATPRSTVEDNFGNSTEFASRVNGLTGIGIPVFSDRGSSRNIIWENNRTTLKLSQQTDATLPNRIIVNFDDAAHENAQRPLVFEGKEGIDAQLRAGRAFGDTTRRAVEKSYSLLGVTDLGEATRLGNLLLHLGEFDEGGLFNNRRVTFNAWFADCLTLRKYRLIKVDSERLDRLNDKRAARGEEPFEYFRIRTMRRLPNLQVEISAQAYPREYYDTLESWTTPPPIVGAPGLPNPGGTPRERPGPIEILPDPTIEPDRIRFTLASEVVT